MGLIRDIFDVYRPRVLPVRWTCPACGEALKAVSHVAMNKIRAWHLGHDCPNRPESLR